MVVIGNEECEENRQAKAPSVVVGLSTVAYQQLKENGMEQTKWRAEIVDYLGENELKVEKSCWRISAEAETVLETVKGDWGWSWICEVPSTMDCKAVVQDNAWPALRLLMRAATLLTMAVTPLLRAAVASMRIAGTLTRTVGMLTRAMSLQASKQVLCGWESVERGVYRYTTPW